MLHLFELCKRLSLPETQILYELERAKAADVLVQVGNMINDKYIALRKVENICEKSVQDCKTTLYINELCIICNKYCNTKAQICNNLPENKQ